MDFRGKKHERGSNWSDQEVVELLQLWSDESVQIELESCLRNQHVFNRIAEVMQGKGILRTGDQCREKIKKLKLEYRRIKENQKTMRSGRSWKFYEVMDRVLTNRPSISYSSVGGNVITHHVLPSTTVSDAYLHSQQTSAFGTATSGAFMFNHPPKPGELMEIKREDVNSDDGILNSDVAAPPELLYHIGSDDEHDADSKSAGLDPEDFTDMGRGEGAAHSGYSPSGFSDQHMAGSSGTGVSITPGQSTVVRDRTIHANHGEDSGRSAPLRQRKRRRAGRGVCGRGLLDEALVSFLNWQRSAEERLLALEEVRLEKEAQAEERRERQEERRAAQEREHELRLLSIFANALTSARSGEAQGPQVVPVPLAKEPISPPRIPAVPHPLNNTSPIQHSKYLSRRGNSIHQHVGILQDGYSSYHTDKYDENSNPNGIINLGTSENKLCTDLLQKRLTQPDMLHIESSLLQYPDWKGHGFFREEVAKFLSHYCRSSSPLKTENVVVMNGCGSLFSAMAAVLCDPEDAILIPTPFYGAIMEDVNLYSSVQLYHVHLDSQPCNSDDRPFKLTVEKLETALMKARKEGVNVRALILINPHNPLGEIYTPQEMTSFLEFAKKNDLHVIVDELYMLSVFEESAVFHSILSFDRLPDAQRTHVLWGLSKDFALAGVRAGFVYSENRELVEALDQLGCFHGVPGPTQYQMAQLLQDRGTDVLSHFITTNNGFPLHFCSQATSRSLRLSLQKPFSLLASTPSSNSLVKGLTGSMESSCQRTG
ncbi:1-aminocyclopropane-1-carboxylate synthase-like protein 1 isoform X2 [Chanos chanos]|uniref:1-aminocyclopropane-1-carboxylate synthase-like protein 1 isoform X2 n=1 Tax=Chanos chanos TaxID=29144 RepID=A0A6J2UNT4_CHACN|nr:1-aminocyclopropane-1-carboxylate synthase-like protein 1 isoform X2 [Chanos chanos]